MITIRAYRTALTISLGLNLLFIVALYYYSSVEGFLSIINIAVGIFG